MAPMSVVPPRRIAPAIGLVCALHAWLLWWAFAHHMASDAVMPSAPVMSTRWLAPKAIAREAESRVAAPSTLARAMGPRDRRVAAPLTEGASPREAPAQSMQPLPPEPALRIDDVQRAARELALRKGVAEMADEQLGRQPVDAQAALRNGMASSARGDCLKGGEGGYANAGMGLFALPLLVLDAASRRCGN